jgi:hypothetical protein
LQAPLKVKKKKGKNEIELYAIRPDKRDGIPKDAVSNISPPLQGRGVIRNEVKSCIITRVRVKEIIKIKP